MRGAPQTRSKPKIVHRRIAAVLIAVLAATSVLIPADAAPNGRWSILSFFGEQLPYSHAYRSDSGTTLYCAFSSKIGPAWLGENVSYTLNTTFTPRTGASFENGFTLQGSNFYKAAYALNRFGNTSSGKAASMVDYELWKYSNRAKSSEYVNKTIAGAETSYISYVQAMDARIDREAGPYVLKAAISHEGLTAKLTNVGLVSGAGAWMKSGSAGLGNAQLKIVLTNAKFADGSTTKNSDLVGSPEIKNLQVVNPSKAVSAALEVANLPGYEISWYRPNQSKYQPMISPGSVTKVSTSVRAEPIIKTPAVSTSTAAVRKQSDGTYLIKDQISINQGTANISAQVVADLYYVGTQPPKQTKTIPSTAVKITSKTESIRLNGTGTATAWTGDVRLPVNSKLGYYTWVTTTGGTNLNTVTSDFGVPQETFLIEQLEAPISLTTVSVDEAGQRVQVLDQARELSDLLKVGDPEGVLAQYPLQVTSTLYGPFDSKPEGNIPADAAKAFVTTTTVHQAGEMRTSASPSDLPSGYYVWGYSYPKAIDIHNGALIYAAVDNLLVYEDEITLIKWHPQIETAVEKQYLVARSQNTDSLRLSGGEPGRTYKVTVNLWGPLADKPILGSVVPEETPLSSSFTIDVVADASGTASIDTESITVHNAGWYTFTASIAASPTSTAYDSQFGIEAETFSVVDVATVATENSMIGNGFTDTALIEGQVPEGSTLVFELWRESPSDSTQNDQLVHTTERISVGEAGEYVSPEVSVAEAGRYYFREKLYLGNEEEPSHYGEPRLPGETTRVHQVYTNATTAIGVGLPFRDSVYLAGDIPSDAYLVFEIYRQDSGEDPLQDKPVATSGKIYVWDGGAASNNQAIGWTSSENDPGVIVDPCGDGKFASEAGFESCAADNFIQVIPIAPILKESETCGDKSTLTVPNAIGVDYQVFETAEINQVKVVAVAQLGFNLAEDATAEWSFDLSGAECSSDDDEETPSVPAEKLSPETALPSESESEILTDSQASLSGLVGANPLRGQSQAIDPQLRELNIIPLEVRQELLTTGSSINWRQSESDLPGIAGTTLTDEEGAEPGKSQAEEEADVRPPRAEFAVFSPVIAVKEEGTYYARASYYVGSGTEPLYVDELRTKQESTRVSLVTTKATTSATVGSDVKDAASIVGAVPEGAYLVFEAYHSGTETNPVKFLQTNPRPDFVTGKIPVTGSGTYQSNAGGDEYSPVEPGMVFWRYVLYQENGLVISQGKIGDEGESTQIVPAQGTTLAKTGSFTRPLYGIFAVLALAGTGLTAWSHRQRQSDRSR